MVAACAALAGCDGAPSQRFVPAAIETLMQAEFPADGAIHVRAKGQFLTRPGMAICTYQKNGGVYKMLLGEELLRISNGRDSANGKMLENAEECHKVPNPIFRISSQTANRNGEPYRLVLAVWQGDVAHGGAYWVGGVERLGGVRAEMKGQRAFRDGIPPPASIGKAQDLKYQQDESVQLDMSDMSKAFVKFVSGKR